MAKRYSQRQYEGNDLPEKGKSGIGPVKDSQMFKRFKDWYTLEVGKQFVRPVDDLPQYYDKFKSTENGNEVSILSDPFYYNQRTMNEYFKHLAEDPLYSGMFEAIGRVTIYASQFLQNPFAKFIKDPLTSGNAHMAGLFKDIRSHEWNPVGKRPGGRDYGVLGIDFANQESEINKITAKPCLYDVPDTGWLFKAETPEFVSTVSRINFSREIALLVNAREYARYCQTPEMVGEIGSALMGMSNAIYMNDMREASKNFFCGILRAGPPPEPDTDAGYGTDLSTKAAVPDGNAMIDVVAIVDRIGDTDDKGKVKAPDLEKEGQIVADGLTRAIHNTIEVDFADFSDKYNPSHLDRISEKCTVVMDAHVRYDTFKKYYATLHHPEFIKPGPEVEFVWINEFPELGTAVYANKACPIESAWKSSAGAELGKKQEYYRLVAMIVDDNAPAIIPYQTPVTVQTFFDPHKEAMSIFTHYQCDFEFKPMFNRKYFYVKYINYVPKAPLIMQK